MKFWLGAEEDSARVALALFGGERVDEVLCRCVEEHDELLERRLESGQKLRPELVLAGHVGELTLDGLAVEDRPVDEARLHLELLARLASVLLERLDDLGGR